MNILEILTTIWAWIGANQLLTIAVGIAIAVIANKAGYVLPEAWRVKLYDMAVAALAKLLGITPTVNVPVSDEKENALLAVDNFMALQEYSKGCPEADEILAKYWTHIRPGHKDVAVVPIKAVAK